jgi:hypothetical protein
MSGNEDERQKERDNRRAEGESEWWQMDER